MLSKAPLLLPAICASMLIGCSTVPQNVWIFPSQAGPKWPAAVQDWQRTAVKSVDHPDVNPDSDNISNSRFVAQSFLPNHDMITAVEIGIYALSKGDEWFRIEIREDVNGYPGDSVLSRAWLRVDELDPNVLTYVLIFDIPDIQVRKHHRYWIIYSALHGSYSKIINLSPVKFSGEDTYADGRAIVWGPFSHSMLCTRSDDMYFRIISESKPIPLMKRAGWFDRKKMPDIRNYDSELRNQLVHYRENISLSNNRLQAIGDMSPQPDR